MALAERAELVARLSLKDEFSGRLGAATSKLKGMEGSLGRIAGHANRGLKNAATNLAKIGVVGGAFVGLQVRSGIQSLATLEDAVTSIDGAIKQVGDGWTITGAQIAEVANRIETDVQRAFDDKEIAQAATTLIRYGDISQDQLVPAMEIMTDLAAKTGDVGSASDALAKALADPTKATRLLRQAGVSLTDAQTKQIKTWVESGDKAKAQAYLLDLVSDKTKGAAAAMNGPYNDAMKILADVTEDAQRALAEGFLPLLTRVADELSTFLADPKNVQKIRDFGKGLADGFDKVLSMGKNIPWGLIGSSLETAGRGAKAVFDAFAGLPPWIQTAVLTGWGLNKLTGGALGSIIGEGIKVTFGQFAARGATPANPLFVSQVGGVGGAAGAGGGLAAAAAPLVIGAAAVQGVMDVATIAQGVGQAYKSYEQGDAKGMISAQQGIFDQVAMFPPGLTALGNLITNEQQKLLTNTLKVSPQGMSPDERQELNDVQAASERTTTAVEGMRGALATRLQSAAAKQTAATERSRNAITARLRETKAAQLNAANRITAATRNGDSRIVSAIRNNRPIVSVKVTSNTIRVTTTGGTVSRNINPNYMKAGL